MLHSPATHCERAVQVLHGHFTHCERAAQVLHSHFTHCERAVQVLHSHFTHCAGATHVLHTHFTHFADITQKGASGSLRACADSHRSRCLLDTIEITPPPEPKPGFITPREKASPGHRSDLIGPLPLAPIFPEAEAIPIYIGIDRMGMADARTHGKGVSASVNAPLRPSFLALMQEKKQKKIKASGTPAKLGKLPCPGGGRPEARR